MSGMFPGLKDEPRCCAYLRKSRKDVERERYGDGDTLAHHRDIIKRTAEYNGHKIETWFEEVVSGETITDRAQMTELLRQVSRNEWDVVYVMEIIRFGRGGGADQERIVNALTLTSTWVITPSGPFDPANKRDVKALKQELRGGEDELEWIKSRLMRGRENAIRNGRWINTANPPYGWACEKVDGAWQLVPDPETHHWMLRVWEMYESGGSVNDITRKLNEMRVPTRRGGRWSTKQVHMILWCKASCGYTYYGKERDVKTLDPETQEVVYTVDRSRKTYFEARGLWYDKCQSGEWGVTEERFDAVQRRFAANAKVRNGLKQVNPLATLLKCGKCGYGLALRVKTRPDGTKKRSFNHPEPYRTGVECSCKTAPLEQVVDAVVSALESACNDIEASVREDVQPGAEAEKIELKRIASSKERVMAAYEAGAYTVEEFVERKASLESRAEALRVEIAKAERAAQEAGKRSELPLRVKESISMLRDPSMPPERVNAALKSIIDHIDYYNYGKPHSHTNDLHLEIFFK